MSGRPIALCPGCREPLISTFAFTGYEFLCICCGRKVTFLGPAPGDGGDPQLRERLAELQAEWDEHVGGHLLPGGRFWRDGCKKCEYEDHWVHVTDDEVARDEHARQWLLERIDA